MNTVEMVNPPQEIKFNIFSKLPVKTLGRFKCVCKEWLNIISDPYFQRLHLERSKKNPQLFLLDQANDADEDEDENRRPQLVQLSAMNMEGELSYIARGFMIGYIHMIPSGHGLVCLINQGVFYIFHPSIKRSIRLPEVQSSAFQGVHAGFGYIQSRNEYKLVHLFDADQTHLCYKIKCEIITLTDGGNGRIAFDSWRQIEDECPFIVSGRGVFAYNRFYWIIWEACHPTEEVSIISLDLETETFESIPHPNYTSYLEDNNISLVELEGQLCLIDTFAYPPVTDIWVLTDPVNKIWVKQHRIDLTALEGFDDELTEITVHGCKNGELIISSQQESLDYYNLSGQFFRKGKNLNLQADTGICLYIDNFF
ncbi:F-box protein [Melia azedarach]|uniref:F-box protein n=1 Tax=Melia azedarach TaxID=155640 RepID=A0ACC1XIF7_MELAZ|nr:F-box protein [Melia azedarach]